MSDSSRHLPQEILSAYLDDELGAAERSEADHHLALCDDCRDALASLRRVARALRDEAVPPVPADLGARVGARIDAAKVRPFRRRFVVPVSIAATVAAVGLLVVYQWSNPGPQPAAPAIRSQDAAQPQAEDLRTLRPAAPAPSPLSVPEPKEASVPARQDRPAPGPPAAAGSAGAVEGAVEGAAGAKDKANKGNRLDRLGYVGGNAGRDAREESDRLKKDESPAAPAMQRAAADAPRASPAPPPATAKSALLDRERATSPCGDRWVDAGVPGTWVVGDMQTALRELGAAAADCGGRGSAEPAGRGEPYELIVPRDRYPELVKILGAKGVTGINPDATPPAGDTCIRQRVAIQVVLGTPPR